MRGCVSRPVGALAALAAIAVATAAGAQLDPRAVQERKAPAATEPEKQQTETRGDATRVAPERVPQSAPVAETPSQLRLDASQAAEQRLPQPGGSPRLAPGARPPQADTGLGAAAGSGLRPGSGGLGARISPGDVPAGADLAITGPAVSEVDGPQPEFNGRVGRRYSHTWTVTNVGSETAHSTTLLLDCEDNQPAGRARCHDGEESWDRVVQLPPLAPGQSFEISSRRYRKDPVTIVPLESDATGDLSPMRHWLRFSATLDPDGLVNEVNRTNNRRELVMANMPQHPGLGAAMRSDRLDATGAGPRLSDPEPIEAGTSGGLGSNAGNLLPRYTLRTEDPWTPGASTWVLARNTGGFDAPPAKVSVTCVDHNAVAWNQYVDERRASGAPDIPFFGQGKVSEDCEFLGDTVLTVPALDAGAVHGLLHVSTPERDLVWRKDVRDPSTPPELRQQLQQQSYTITFEAPAGDRLVLSTRPRLGDAGSVQQRR